MFSKKNPPKQKKILILVSVLIFGHYNKIPELNAR